MEIKSLAIYGSVLTNPEIARDIDVAAMAITGNLGDVSEGDIKNHPTFQAWLSTQSERVQALPLDIHVTPCVPLPFGKGTYRSLVGTVRKNIVVGLSAALRAFGNDPWTLTRVLQDPKPFTPSPPPDFWDHLTFSTWYGENGVRWGINNDPVCIMDDFHYEGNGPQALQNALRHVTPETLTVLKTLPIYNVIQRTISREIFTDKSIVWRGCPAGTTQFLCTWDGQVSTLHQ